MVETYYVGSYWLNRQETAQACAMRAERFLQYLAPLDATWGKWFLKARSREEALKRRIEPVAATFESLFAQKKYEAVKGGFLIGLWNGEETPQATRLDITCGMSFALAPNLCILYPPAPAKSAVGERIVNAGTMAQVLRAMALAWEPDWGVVMSNDYRDRAMPGKLPPVLVGWVTYLSRRRGNVPPLPDSVRVEPVGDLGSLITLTPERITADNPAHVDLARRVRGLLEQAGLLAAP